PARTSSARPWRQPPPSPAPSPMSATWREVEPMQPFTTVTALAAPLDMPNVDTDQIIPARFLKRPKDDRYRVYMFHDLRFEDEGGAEKPGFLLNQEPWRQAQILVADRNFGCGSSRES